MRYWPLGQR
jgi:uncharacterized membrane protein YeaQ/YmgE (transglycosylase-associated protein family)